MNEENKEEAIKQIEMLESIARKYLTKEALSRYGNLKIAHPEIAIKAIAAIAQAVQFGHLERPLTDKEFKELLIEIQKGKKGFHFKR